MRDRNLNLVQFNIQLEKSFSKYLFEKTERLEKYFFQKSCLWRSDPETPNSQWFVRIPKDFRLLRSLAISVWYFPENLRTLYLLELKEKKFRHLNFKQQVELNILLSSKNNCLKYLLLTERYTASEVFGNILGNDLKDLERILKISFWKQTAARKKIFRRGPKDQGSRRSDSSISVLVEEIQKDVFILAEEEEYKKKKTKLHNLVTRLLIYLENWSEES